MDHCRHSGLDTACEASIRVIFLWQIRWWGQISCSTVQISWAAVQISWQKGKIAVNWDLHHGIAHIKGQIGVVFQGQSSDEVKSAVQLYKSADFKIIITVSFDPLDGFGQSKSHFGVVFWGQSNGDTKSPVTVQISWLQNHYHCIFWSTGQIWTIKESFWGSFSRPT
mgnify:CR=1 FL=1